MPTPAVMMGKRWCWELMSLLGYKQGVNQLFTSHFDQCTS